MDVARRRLLLAPLGLLGGRALAETEYPDVRRDVALAFPGDEAAHPAFRNEWWYVTGWLRDARARERGFQITFFRNRPGVAEASGSRFAPRQLLFAHAALADPENQRLIVDQRAAREGFGLAHASEHGMDVRIDDWSLVGSGQGYRTSIRGNAFGFEFAFEGRAPILLQGDEGVSRKGVDPRDASYYYSRPHLRVDGSLTTHDRSTPVSGVAWLDHEWSSRYLTQGAVGWDWAGVNLDDGGALMVFRIRDARGDPLWAGGAHRDAHGVRRVFGPADVAFAPVRHWRSPRTGVSYPVSLRVHTAEGEWMLEPLFDDQELDARAGVGVLYWEGAVRASGDGHVAGRGYLELTGYGAPLRI